MKLATAQQMRQIDQRAISKFDISSIDLMEAAARSITDEIITRFPGQHSASIVCGPGNNGGDGLAVARILTVEYGWRVSAWLCQTSESNLSSDRESNYALAHDEGVPIDIAEGPDFAEDLMDADITIDAILGTASSGPPRQNVADTINLINTYSRGTVIAIDIPTGVNCDTGEVATDAVHADLTITLGFSKHGLHLSPGYQFVGELVVRGDFLPDSLLEDNEKSLSTIVTIASDIRNWLPTRNPTRDSNKGTFGAVMILAGSHGFVGAACLAGLGAARAGAGTVTLGVPDSLMDVMMVKAPEVTMTQGFDDQGKRHFSPISVPDILEAISKKDAIGVGPGISHESPEIKQFVLELITQCDKPMVIDADALTIIAALGDDGVSALRGRKAATILTPHPGEMARILGVKTADVQADRLGSVRKAAEKFGCVVLLKGDRTLIASPDGRLAINQTGNPGMASGGMGDVLTGIATTCLAQIDNPFHAATAAAYIHGFAGDIARDTIGVAGILATDIAEKVPQAITRCLRDLN